MPTCYVCLPSCLVAPLCTGALRALRRNLRTPTFASLDDAAYGASLSESSSSGAEGRATQFVRRSRGVPRLGQRERWAGIRLWGLDCFEGKAPLLRM